MFLVQSLGIGFKSFAGLGRVRDVGARSYGIRICASGRRCWWFSGVGGSGLGFMGLRVLGLGFGVCKFVRLRVLGVGFRGMGFRRTA